MTQPPPSTPSSPSYPPPPPGDQAVWFYQLNGQQAGPVTLSTLQTMIHNGAIQPTTMVWRDGMAAWAPAGGVPELAFAFNVVRQSGQGGALGLNNNGLILFIVLLLVCIPLCWLPWVIEDLRAKP